VQLRDYQITGKAAVRRDWDAGARNVLWVAPPGAGKTFMFGTEIAEEPTPSIAVAHRRELIGQMSTTLARLGVRHRIIAPPAVIGEIVTRHVAAVGRSYYDPGARAGVASVQTLVRRDLGEWGKLVTKWVCDECFPAGTLVDGKPIETLVVGDKVTAFNEVTGGFEPRKITRVFKNKYPKRMVRVLTEAHHAVTSTAAHPFWTKRGWVDAWCLSPGDEVLVDEMYLVRCGNSKIHGKPEVPVSQSWSGFLFGEGLWSRLPGAHKNPRLGTEVEETSTGRSCLHGMRETRGPHKAQAPHLGEERPGVLQRSLLYRVSAESVLRDRAPDQPPARIGSDETEQSDAFEGNSGKSVPNASREENSTQGAWRQRETAPESGGGFGGYRRGSGIRPATSDSDGTETTKRVAAADAVSAGLRQPPPQTGIGGGWPDPQREATSGREKGSLFGWARVDSVEVLECGDNDESGHGVGDGYVYNIEVEDLHTYVANGIVVHNCHHLVRDSQWDEALAQFPNARGLLVTGTPERADGKGLGRHADGVIDSMVLGPSWRELIERGYLLDYRIAAPESGLDLSTVAVSSSTGDYVKPGLVEATRKSRVTGDIVESYLRIAKGKRGITFCVSVELAEETAQRFREAGVPAECVHAGTPGAVRAEIVRRFERGDVLQMVNVDLFGEGYDCPACDVVSMGRATTSFPWFAQAFGRPCRPHPGQTHAWIIDHVGNVLARHGVPDAPRKWSLDRRERRSRTTAEAAVPIRACVACAMVYERYLAECPYCGHVPVPASRARPEFVDGDLLELDPAVLARLRGEVAARVEKPPAIPYGATTEVQHAILNRHARGVRVQQHLREQIAWWAGLQRALGRSDAEGYRRFYLQFGTDAMTAQTLAAKEAGELAERINQTLVSAGVVTENAA